MEESYALCYRPSALQIIAFLSGVVLKYVDFVKNDFLTIRKKSLYLFLIRKGCTFNEIPCKVHGELLFLVRPPPPS